MEGELPIDWDFSVRWAVLDSGERLPLLTLGGPYGVPNTSVTLYALTDLRARCVPGTIEIALRGIGVGLAFCRKRGIDLSERVAQGTFLIRSELTALHEFMRRGKRKAIVDPIVSADRFYAFIRYVEWFSEPILARVTDLGNKRFLRGAKDEFHRLAYTVGPKHTTESARGNPGARHGMRPEQRELFLRVIAPGHPDNPFREDLQLRNAMMLSLCYYLGIRAGELCGLMWADINFKSRPALVTIQRRHDNPVDPRKRQPSAKTRARVLAIHEYVADLLMQWQKQRSNRSAFPNARTHPFVCVNEDGDPLTAHGLSHIYQMLRERHPSLPTNLSTHLLRHDWNDRWIEELESVGERAADHEADQIYQMGWSDRSKMPARYAHKAIETRSNSKNMALQRKALEKKG